MTEAAEREATAPDLVRQAEVPAAARALATLAAVDYEDGFRVDARFCAERSGEEWARSTLEGASPGLRRSLRWGWTALGLELDRGDPDRSILGWTLLHSDPHFALLAAGSRIGMPAELLFEPEGDVLFFATFVRQRNPLAKALWAAIAPRHRRVVPYLLGRAARG